MEAGPGRWVGIGSSTVLARRRASPTRCEQRVIEAAGFTLELRLVPRLDIGAARQAKGRELADVLLLAAAFPARPRPIRLSAPIFGRERP